MAPTRATTSTRRHFGAAAGGLAIAVADLLSPPQADGKERRKKRCKRLRATCTPGGKRKCCNALRCGEVPTQPGFFCCKRPHTPCESLLECCGNRICSTVDGLTGTFCCGNVNTTPCQIDEDCCTGFGCFEGFCKLA